MEAKVGQDSTKEMWMLLSWTYSSRGSTPPPSLCAQTVCLGSHPASLTPFTPLLETLFSPSHIPKTSEESPSSPSGSPLPNNPPSRHVEHLWTITTSHMPSQFLCSSRSGREADLQTLNQPVGQKHLPKVVFPVLPYGIWSERLSTVSELWKTSCIVSVPKKGHFVKHRQEAGCPIADLLDPL